MTSPEHIFIASDGDMYDTRVQRWNTLPALRPGYRRTFGNIKTVSQLKATLRNGAFAWPGGYPLYLICSDGESLCFDCGRKEARNIFDSIANRRNDGWRVVACDVHYEGEPIICAHCGGSIESAYGNPDAEESTT